jgi:Na+-translocating ferredoxin:NAD+ oxidoreductase subunit G
MPSGATLLTITFNNVTFLSLPMRNPRLSAPLGLLLAALAFALPAHATEYWTKSALLAEFFKAPGGKVAYRAVTLTDADVAEIGKKLGAKLEKNAWTVYVAQDGDGKRVGYAILDHEIGLHEAIDYGVRFGLNGAVDRVEIREYREAYGDEVRSERFRKQFVGKTANDPIVAGRDIDIVSGASYSSRALALGIKRDALILQAALKTGL